MDRKDKYDISSSTYVQDMDRKIEQYKSLINQAQMFRRSYGKPTAQEGKLYEKAIVVCEEIINMNTHQREVGEKWKRQMEVCNERVEEIAKVLYPSNYAKVPQAPSGSSAKNNSKKASASAQPSSSATAGAGEFTTKNAIKDVVSAETIAQWHKPMPDHGFDDVTGQEDLKERLRRDVAYMGYAKTDKMLGINPMKSYLFYGPPGNGKTFLIEAFANELMKENSTFVSEQNRFHFIQLLGSEVHAKYKGVAEKTVQIACQEALDNAPCLLFFDEIDGVCADRNDPETDPSSRKLTNAFLEALNRLYNEGKDIIFIGATNCPNRLDTAMMDRLTPIRTGLPGVEDREKYFKRQFRNLAIDDDITTREMAESTENYSYRDLNKVTSSVKQYIKDAAIQMSLVTVDSVADQEKTDIAATEAIKEGKVKLSKDLFYKCKNSFTVTDKTEILKSLDAYEKRIQVSGLD